jgi:hypothetical protein
MTEDIAVLQDLPTLEQTNLLELEAVEMCAFTNPPCAFISCIITNT